jgi:hypothetical protein
VWLVLDILALAASWGCVRAEEEELRYKGARFNDRISADLQGLTPAEENTDLCYGVFSDGSADPDGPNSPRTGSLVSEIFPVTAADSMGPGKLVQAPTLFVGRSRGNGDEIRISWEVVTSLDPQEGTRLKDLVHPDYPEVGLCSLSGPVSRLMFEDHSPGATMRQMPPYCLTSGDGSFAGTFNEDPLQNKNIPNNCRFLVSDVVRVEAFHPAGANPDGLPPAVNAMSSLRCGTDRFIDGGAEQVQLYGCTANNGLFPACGLPCGFSPTQDASYRVRVDMANPVSLPAVERWLNPNVMVVDGTRTIARPMTQAGSTATYSWQTEVLRPGGMEGPFRWAENFTRTIRIDTIQIISRDRNGGTEKTETPDQRRLTALVPIAGQASPSVLQCTGRDTGTGLVFDMATCSTSSDVPGGFTSLTPTYNVANLAAAVVEQRPIEWRVSLPGFDTSRNAFIRFGLRAQTMGAALRVSPAHNFGKVPDTDFRQGTIQLENIGGETITVHDLGLVAGLWQPQDFSVFAIGDPVPVPLPFEARTGAAGTTLTLADLRDTPMVTTQQGVSSVTIRLGDPAVPPGTPQTGTLYGQPATLRGGVLTRTSASSVFTPTTSDPRPFAVPGYLEKRPPFTLRPGEKLKVAVEVRPTAHGLRRASLRISGVPASNPSQTITVQSQLQVEVVSGPLLQFAPNGIYIHRQINGAQPTHKTAVLFNAGHVDLNLTSISISGSGASRFVATTNRGTMGPFILPPGDYVDVRVEYLPQCDGTYGNGSSALDHEATLVVSSNGGTGLIPLGGASQGFCP